MKTSRPYPAPIQRPGPNGPGILSFPTVQHALSYPWLQREYDGGRKKLWGALANADTRFPFPGRLVHAHLLRPRKNIAYLVEMLDHHGYGGAQIAALALTCALTYCLAATS